MSIGYDSYIEKHKAGVKNDFKWISENLPEILTGGFDYEWQIDNHDFSKTDADEYVAYDAYFYGNNRSFEVVQNFNRAWLTHIHKNPHHWQHWVLHCDEPDEGVILIEMPMNYVVEMICDWWAFSWNKGDLTEIFNWYDEHKDYIQLHKNTRKVVEDILSWIKDILNDSSLSHHGMKGQKWGVRNGPPYPIDKSKKNDKMVMDAIDNGEVSTKVKTSSQNRHTKDGHTPGRSYLDGDVDYAQRLINKLSGTGEPVVDKDGNWRKKERVINSSEIGVHVDGATGVETRTNKAMIIYSKDGAHIYPRR